MDSDGPPFAFKHLSGAEKRKKREAELARDAKLAKQSKQFFDRFKITQQTPSDSTSFQEHETGELAAESNTGNESDLATRGVPCSDHPSLRISAEVGIEDAECSNPLAADFEAEAEASNYSDPANWPLPITSQLRRILAIKGPVNLILNSYPKRNGYSFNASFFQFQLRGNSFKREWLVYSELNNSLYCFPCSLFEQKSGIGYSSPFQISSMGTSGFCDFHHTSRGILTHESTQQHFSNAVTWKSFLQSMKNETLIDEICEKEAQSEVQHWKKVLHGILDAILFLAKNNLAFRGSSSSVDAHDCGNFLSLIKLLSKYYAPLEVHLSRLRKFKTSYLSPQIQNEFISLCGNQVREAILKEIRSCKYFSIMFDSTPDSSKQEQISQIIRIVHCNQNGCVVKEYFIDFISSEEKTGAGIADVVMEKLKRDKLQIHDCRGQGYDNGSNMSGAYKGVQSRIRETCPEARYIPCAAHSLNLVGVNAAEGVHSAKLLLGQVQNIFLFFHSSTSRWQFLKQKLGAGLRGQSTTRWSSRSEAVGTLATQYPAVIEALVMMSEREEFNTETVAGADSHLNIMMTFKFLLGVTIWHRILYNVELCNLTLQRETGNLEVALKKLEALVAWMKEFRTSGFSLAFEKAKNIADEIGIDPESGFENVRSTRMAKKRRMGETTEDTVKTMTNLQQFESFFFNELLDNLIMQMNERFNQIRECNDDFGFLWGNKLCSLSEVELERHAKDLSMKYNNDLDPINFPDEVKYVKQQIPLLIDNKLLADLGPNDILNTIFRHDLQSCFPNVTIALRIILTLPVTVASNERAFSKLKIIKNYLRSSMGQERLTNLGILSIEHEVTSTIDFDELIAEFSEKKCRRMPTV